MQMHDCQDRIAAEADHTFVVEVDGVVLRLLRSAQSQPVEVTTTFITFVHSRLFEQHPLLIIEMPLDAVGLVKPVAAVNQGQWPTRLAAFLQRPAAVFALPVVSRFGEVR